MLGGSRAGREGLGRFGVPPHPGSRRIPWRLVAISLENKPRSRVLIGAASAAGRVRADAGAESGAARPHSPAISAIGS
jgi:hypothetical protein